MKANFHKVNTVNVGELKNVSQTLKLKETKPDTFWKVTLQRYTSASEVDVIHKNDDSHLKKNAIGQISKHYKVFAQ
jgi:hypothetical protein